MLSALLLVDSLLVVARRVSCDCTVLVFEFLKYIEFLRYVQYSWNEYMYVVSRRRPQQSCVKSLAIMDSVALQEAIRDMDRRKVQDDVDSAAKSGLDAAASIGTETPLVILRDIRKCIMDLEGVTRERELVEQEREKRREERHVELIATLQRMAMSSNTGGSVSRHSMSRDSIGSSTTIADERKFYWHDTAINTGAQIVAAVLMQFDKLLRNSGQLPNISSSDSVIMDLKAWSSCILKIAAVESVVTNTRTKVSLPKPKQQESITAMEITSSTTQGRDQPFRMKEASRLQQECVGLMGIVEEVRQRLIRCPGILPDSRRERLAYLSFPYITRDEDLNISMVCEGFARASPIIVETVPKWKEDSKKTYISEVLGNGTKPIIAFNRARPATN